MKQENKGGENFIEEMKAVAQAQQETTDKSQAKSLPNTNYQEQFKTKL